MQRDEGGGSPRFRLTNLGQWFIICLMPQGATSRRPVRPAAEYGQAHRAGPTGTVHLRTTLRVARQTDETQTTSESARRRRVRWTPTCLPRLSRSWRQSLSQECKTKPITPYAGGGRNNAQHVDGGMADCPPSRPRRSQSEIGRLLRGLATRSDQARGGVSSRAVRRTARRSPTTRRQTNPITLHIGVRYSRATTYWRCRDGLSGYRRETKPIWRATASGPVRRVGGRARR
jgi:hypothetical protein